MWYIHLANQKKKRKEEWLTSPTTLNIVPQPDGVGLDRQDCRHLNKTAEKSSHLNCQETLQQIFAINQMNASLQIFLF